MQRLNTICNKLGILSLPLFTLQKHLKTSSFLSDSLRLSIANMVANALNYAFMVTGAFLLSSDEFGVLGTATSILTMLTIIGNIIQLQVTTLIGNNSTPYHLRPANYLKRIVYWLMPLSITIIYFSKTLAATIHANAAIVILTLIAFFGIVSSCIANGVTSGLRELSLQARIMIYSYAGKFTLGALLFWIGWGAAGGMIASIIGYFSVYLLSQRVFTRINLSKNALSVEQSRLSLNQQPNLSSYSIKLALIYLLLVAPMVCDQILLQSINPILAGPYAALGILGKIIFFLCAPVLGAVFAHANSENDPTNKRALFTKACYLLFIIAGSFIAGWATLGSQVGHLLLPVRYHLVLADVPLASFGITCFCVTYLFILRAISNKNFLVAASLIPAILLQVTLFHYRSANITEVVQNQFLVYSLQLISVCIAMRAGTIRLFRSQ